MTRAGLSAGPPEAAPQTLPVWATRANQSYDAFGVRFKVARST